jgi:hypothetical protein
MSFSDIPFAAIRQLLLDLGFVERAMARTPVTHVPAIVFGHAGSGAVFLFRTYRPQDQVSMMDLVGVRKDLDWRGLLSEEAFDAALRKASA